MNDGIRRGHSREGRFGGIGTLHWQAIAFLIAGRVAISVEKASELCLCPGDVRLMSVISAVWGQFCGGHLQTFHSMVISKLMSV